jgi:hypothetical protein
MDFIECFERLVVVLLVLVIFNQIQARQPDRPRRDIGNPYSRMS